MLLVIDTNVLLSGLLWHGPPHALLGKVRDGVADLVLSPALIAELADASHALSLQASWRGQVARRAHSGRTAFAR